MPISAEGDNINSSWYRLQAESFSVMIELKGGMPVINTIDLIDIIFSLYGARKLWARSQAATVAASS